MIELIRRLVALRLFSREAEPACALDVIQWWEVRRLAYNALVGATGIATLALMLATVLVCEAAGKPIVGSFTVFLAVPGVIGYGIGANVCYTGGWMAELLARAVWEERAGAFGEIAFTLGTVFSIAMTLLPGAATMLAGAFVLVV